MLRYHWHGHSEIASKREKQPELILEEEKIRKLTKEEWDYVEQKVALDKYNLLKEARDNERRKFLKVLNSIDRIEPTFGRPYFEIEIDVKELVMLKKELENQ